MEIYQAAIAAISFALVIVLSRHARLPAFLSLLIAAFAFDVTEKIRGEAVKKYINQLINQHIPASNG